MPAYQGGTVWLQVVPSFDGLQASIRRGVGEAFQGAGVDQAAAKAFKDVEKQAGRAGEASGKAYASTFETLTRDRIKKIGKDFDSLRRSLPAGEFAKIRAVLNDISKFDLTTVTGQAKAVDQLTKLRGGFQDLFDAADKGQVRLSDPARWNLGFIRKQVDEINAALRQASGPDPIAARRQAELQKAGQMQERAQREMAAAERKRMAETDRAYRDMQRGIMQGVKELDQQQVRAHRAQIARIAEERRQGELQARAEKQNVQYDVSLNTARLQAEKRRIRNELSNLEFDAKMGLDTREATIKAAALRADLERLENEKHEAKIDLDTDGLTLQLRKVESQIGRTTSLRGALGGFLDAGAAANAVRVFNGVLFTTVSVGPLLIPVLAAIAAGIFGVGAAALGAVAGVGVLVAGLAGIGGAVGALAELDRARRQERGGAGAARDQAAQNRQAIQDARSVADAQKNLARARRDAAQSIQDANRRVNEAEKDVARAHRDAAEAAEDAAERVADAREDLARASEEAARAAQDAARRVRDAEESLTDAQRDAADAQLRLNEARQQAVRDLEDLKNALDDSRLNEQSLTFEVEEAAAHLNAVLEDDQATQRERDKAQLAYDKAVEALEQQQLQTKRLTADQKKAAKEGVEGSDRVRDAREAVADANERVRDAERAVADARAAADRSAIDNARQLADAREAVNDAVSAQADIAEDNAERINAAEQALDDARYARGQANIAATESIADAQLGLARAHEDIALRSREAALGTDGLATATDNLEEAMRNLSPAGVAFALWLYSLSPLLRELRFAAQNGLLPGLQDGLSAIVDEYGPSFVDFVGEMAGVLGDLGSEFGNMLAEDDTWRDFFSMMSELGPVFLRQFGDASIALLTAFAAIMTAFAPFIAEMGEGFVGLTEDFRDWAIGLEDSKALQDFFQYLRDAGPEVEQLLGNVGEIIRDLFIGLAPYADDLLDAFVGLTDWLADMDPDEIAAIALSIGALVLIVQTLALALGAISGVAGLIGGVGKLGGSAGKVAGAVGGKVGGGAAAKGAAAGAAPAAGLAIEGVGGAAGAAGKKLIGFLGPVGLAVSILWLLWDAASWLDDEFNLLGGTTDDVSTAMGDAWNWLWENSISPVWELIKGVLDVFGQMFETVGEIVDQVFRHIIGPAFEWLWDNTLGPWWDEHVQPMLSKFGNWVEENLPEAIEKGVNLIADIWNGMLNIFRNPIRAAIEIVWNKGIIGSFNWLAEKVPGMTPIDPIDIPASLYPNGRKYAQGTSEVLPGYTPGRDVHRFVSPTAGVLDLSGGEGIAVPEIVRAVGPGRFQAANRAARAGNVGLAQRYLGGFADGGIIGDILDKIKGVGGALMDPLGFFDKVVDSSLDSWGVGGMFGDIIGPMVKGVPRAVADWIGDLLTPSGGGGGGRPAGAMGWETMWSLVSSQFPGANLHSAYRPGAITAVGTPSYHGQGRAIDITPSMEIFNWLASTFRNATELIFSPAGGRQLWNGQQYLFGEPTRGDHWDHIHWAMSQGGIMPTLYDQGGDVPPGLSIVANKTNKPEVTLTNKFVEEVRSNMNRRDKAIDMRGSQFGYDPREVGDAISRKRSDDLALDGIFDEPGVF